MKVGRPVAPAPHQLTAGRARFLLAVVAVLALSAVALWSRLHNLGLPFDRDYDEGVYWQTLRALAAGYSLYDSVFYAQPPFFILSVFPLYALLGQTIWSARLAVAIMSLLGLLGAFLLGRALAGKTGGVVALLLLVADALYSRASQTLQAEAPAIAFSLLTVP